MIATCTVHNTTHPHKTNDFTDMNKQNMTNSQQLRPFLIHQMNSCCVTELSEKCVYARKHVRIHTVLVLCFYVWIATYLCVYSCVCVWVSRSTSQA